MSDHYSMDLHQDEDGWWHGRCRCGRDLGLFPDAEDACDALMDHAYATGASDAYTRTRALEFAAMKVRDYADLEDDAHLWDALPALANALDSLKNAPPSQAVPEFDPRVDYPERYCEGPI